MKIGGVNSINIINNYKGNVEKIKSKDKIQKNQDVIEISNEGKTLNAYSVSMPDVDNSSRIEDIKNRIANGTYDIDPAITAKSMINFMGENDF